LNGPEYILHSFYEVNGCQAEGTQALIPGGKRNFDLQRPMLLIARNYGPGRRETAPVLFTALTLPKLGLDSPPTGWCIISVKVFEEP